MLDVVAAVDAEVGNSLCHNSRAWKNAMNGQQQLKDHAEERPRVHGLVHLDTWLVSHLRRSYAIGSADVGARARRARRARHAFRRCVCVLLKESFRAGSSVFDDASVYSTRRVL